MSIIIDALRKAEEEKKKVSTTDPLYVNPYLQRPKRTQFKLILLVGLLALLIAGIVASIGYIMERGSGKSQSTAQPAVRSATPPAIEHTPPVDIRPLSNPSPSFIETPLQEPQATSDKTHLAGKSSLKETPSLPALSTSPSQGLFLSGIIHDPTGGSTAIVNDQIVVEGDTVEGYTVSRISNRSVRLTANGNYVELYY